MFMKKEKNKSIKKSNQIIQKLKFEISLLKEEIRTDVTGPVIASFGFIIALIWRDAIQSAINEFLKREGLLEKAWIYQFFSAILITIFVITIMVTITRISRKRKQEKINKIIKHHTKKSNFKELKE